jgi:hypothetical protein
MQGIRKMNDVMLLQSLPVRVLWQQESGFLTILDIRRKSLR